VGDKLYKSCKWIMARASLAIVIQLGYVISNCVQKVLFTSKKYGVADAR